MGRVWLSLVLILSLAGCASLGFGNASNRANSEKELPFRAKLKTGEGRAFSVSVANRGAGLDQVRESVRFEATKYCLLQFGGSDATWEINPATKDWAFTRDGSSLVFRGTCSVR